MRYLQAGVCLIALFVLSQARAQAQEPLVISPANRVAVLELYTSEGCSSCPPADTFLSELKDMGISDRQLLPMAFHVTYWDYIGWQDRFARKQFDERQYQKSVKSGERNIYTPQFMLSGKPFRDYGRIGEAVSEISRQPANIELALYASRDGAYILRWQAKAQAPRRLLLYLALLENDLSSLVTDGENEGERLQHDYVVRHLSAPVSFLSSHKSGEARFPVEISPRWQRRHMSVMVFAEDAETGEILQAVRAPLTRRVSAREE